MDKEPSRYEQRIGEYMERMQLSAEARKTVSARLAGHKSLFGRVVKDIFFCNGTPGDAPRKQQSLWVFTSDVASEMRDAASQVDIDFAKHSDVRYVKLTARESDLFSVSNSSLMTMQISYAGGHESTLTAHGQNCLQLMTMFRKYFSRHMAPF